ncbi:MAG: EamA family transporter, partial [Amylibacter sp.]
MTLLSNSWQFWAFLAAIFAALTAIFAKVGVSDVDSDFATFLRTIVVVAALGLLVWATGKVQNLGSITPRTWVFLILSGL